MTPRPPLTVSDDNHVRSIGIDRPDVHNALNHAVVTSFVDALRTRPADTMCVVVFGHGSSFCAGGDRRQGIADAQGETLETLHALQEITRQLQQPEIVSIAAVEGWAIGGGAELALACDMVFAGTGATFRFPEVELGAHATGGSTWLLPRAVGRSRANFLMLTGQPLDAQRAAEWGLVTELTGDGEALARSQEIAKTIAPLDREVVASMKRSLQLGVTGTLEEALAHEVDEAHPRLGPGGFLG